MRQDPYFFVLVCCPESVFAYNRCVLIISWSEFLFKIKWGCGEESVRKMWGATGDSTVLFILSVIYSNEGWLGPPFLFISSVYFLAFNRLIPEEKIKMELVLALIEP